MRAGILIVAGTALLTFSAKVNVPLPYVPMTMQTLVVLMIGAAYGARLGLATVLAYLAEGALGLPVFAGPVGGVAYMMGGTGGFLAAFAIAAFGAGWFCERGWDRSVSRMLVVMTAGHVVILTLGFAWLAFGINLGPHKAWLVGIMPFIAGTVVKSLLGALLMPVLWRAADRKRDR
ncbi:biotin transporter BioY [Bradyrhizobium sp. LHD-71]|uniref:biotin transporter BioY n=1 Tax=Bradyrhizobium sp. LHD-71 TaxID=3072141 RepID=UPI00280DFB97|nr:biotin transporter BioY [Bradyrhizobium sp. LHD-71]MDQ8729982.1 biotin transporter BioY [Bradyrhizobium sp. LHD-71]